MREPLKKIEQSTKDYIANAIAKAKLNALKKVPYQLCSPSECIFVGGKYYNVLI